MNRCPSLTRSLLLGVASMLAAACTQTVGEEGVEQAEQTVVGGTEAAASAWPGTVALYSNGEQICGGALIADTWVLTAGHCIDSSRTNGGISNVVIGRQRLSSGGGESIAVKKATVHPGFSMRTLDNDIALLQLAKKSTSPRVKLIRADQAAAIAAGTNVTVVGWGLERETSWQTSDVLRQVTLPVISNSQCRSYRYYEAVTDKQICAGYPAGGKDACQGDSGGPLYAQIGGETVDVGIVSWGIGCARSNSPGVYTRISSYLSWIAQATGGAAGSSDGGAGTSASGDAEEQGVTESGVVKKGQSAAYAYDVPAGTYDIVLSGDGDADLYVRKNAAPTAASYDCRPYLEGSSESCKVTFSSAGRLYVNVVGYAATTTYSLAIQ